MLSNVQGTWGAYYLWLREAFRSLTGGNPTPPFQPVRPSVDLSPDAVVLNEAGNNLIADLVGDMLENAVTTVETSLSHRQRWANERKKYVLTISVKEVN